MSLKRSLGWMSLAQGSSFLLQFGGSVVLARYLSPHETGIYAVALAVVGVLALIQALGLQALIVREEVLTPEISATAFTVNALIALVLAAAIAAVSVAGGIYLHDPGVQRVLLVLAVNPLFGILSFLPSANLERSGRFRDLALISSAAGAATTIFTVVLAINGFSYMSIAYAQWVNGLVTVIAMNWVGRHYVGFRFGLQAWRRVADFGLQIMAVNGISAVSGKFSDVLMGRFLGLSALGLYIRAAGLNGLVWNNIHMVVGRVLFVNFAEVHRRGESLRGRYLQTVAITTAVLWPAFAGLAVMAGPFIYTVYGPRWTAAVAPLILLSVSSIVQVAITMTWELFAATGNLRDQTRIEFIRAGLAIAMFAVGCLISLEAAAAARLLDALFAVFLYRPYLSRMTGTRTADFAGIYGQGALVTLAAIGPALLVLASNRFMSSTSLLWMLPAVALGIGLWATTLFWLRHPLAGEVAATLRARFASMPGPVRAPR